MTRRRFQLISLGFATAAVAYPQASDDAAKSGEAWLALIDAQKYADSWTEASGYFRSRMPRDQWVNLVRGVRTPLGALKSRTVKSQTTAKSLPGAPDGDYTVIQYQTSFQNKASAIETLTLAKEGGKWRGAGYFIN